MPDATKAPSSIPVGVDTTRASIARVYDAALNGKDNFEIDREVLRQVAAVAPQVNDLAWSNRNFLIRACRFLAGQAGITQYLDCGSGLPTAENTHQVVQRLVPEAKVLYIDNDPVVLAHGRALLEENDRTHLISADIFEPRAVLDDPVTRQHLDFTDIRLGITSGVWVPLLVRDAGKDPDAPWLVVAFPEGKERALLSPPAWLSAAPRVAVADPRFVGEWSAFATRSRILTCWGVSKSAERISSTRAQIRVRTYIPK